MQNKIGYLILLMSIMFLNPSIGQNGDNSPFSRFGIGDLIDENFMYSRSMGGLGSSYVSQYQINIVNPASYASLVAAAFDFGVYGKYSKLSDRNGQSSTLWNGNLEYISLAFPLTNAINELLDRERKNIHLGMNFTLMPHSVVGYNILSEEFLEGTGNYTRNYNGSGGSYKFYWGNALKYKNLSFGLNMGFLFGNIRYEQNTAFNDLTNPLNNAFVNTYSLNGFLWNAGVQYAKVLNKKELADNKNASVKRISIGLRGHTNTSFNTEADVLNRTVQIFNGSVIKSDTLETSQLGVAGNGTLPAEVGIGITYWSGNKMSIGMDLGYSNWSAYKNDANPDELSNTFSISLGGFIRPDYKSYNNYFKRVYYRYGFFYKSDPREIENDRIKNYGVTFGLGMPFIYQRKISHANLGFEIGLKGRGTPIQETYGKFTLSFTFNDDEWFIKRKYD